MTSAPQNFGWYRPWLTDVQASELTAAAKSLAAVLATHERDGVVRETTAELGAAASLSPKTVRAAATALADKGFVKRRRSRGHIVINLQPRTGVAPVLGPQNGSGPRSRTGVAPLKNGSGSRSRTGVAPVSPVTAVSSASASPPNPLTEGELGTQEISVPKIGARNRDLEQFKRQVADVTSRLYGDAAVGSHRQVVDRAVRAGARTDAEIRRYVDTCNATGRPPVDTEAA